MNRVGLIQCRGFTKWIGFDCVSSRLILFIRYSYGVQGTNMFTLGFVITLIICLQTSLWEVMAVNRKFELLGLKRLSWTCTLLTSRLGVKRKRKSAWL